MVTPQSQNSEGKRYVRGDRDLPAERTGLADSQCNVNGGRNDHSTDGSRNGQRGQAEPAPTLIDKAVINQAINSVLAPQTVSSDSDSV